MQAHVQTAGSSSHADMVQTEHRTSLCGDAKVNQAPALALQHQQHIRRLDVSVNCACFVDHLQTRCNVMHHPQDCPVVALCQLPPACKSCAVALCAGRHKFVIHARCFAASTAECALAALRSTFKFDDGVRLGTMQCKQGQSCNRMRRAHSANVQPRSMIR